MSSISCWRWYADQVNEEQKINVGKPIEQQVSHQGSETTLRISTRIKRSRTSNHYEAYLQELDYNVGAKNDPKTFSQDMSSNNLNLLYNAMKYEMDSMTSNQLWDLVELFNGVMSIGCIWVYKTKKSSTR